MVIHKSNKGFPLCGNRSFHHHSVDNDNEVSCKACSRVIGKDVPTIRFNEKPNSEVLRLKVKIVKLKQEIMYLRSLLASKE